ncbi:hypothetical protein Psuf_088800 [Phytohabitans suffuscus]|uniref:Uncharacterized protein n=1 Tax=Phytohabitans suffuscus TaxID=624315 RepID=A0A6F8YZK3_9ACTN|nr:hypothetical protein Psuf_088800 [Phytohabitans suffuscus]
MAGSRAFEGCAEFAWFVLLVRVIVDLSDPMRTHWRAVRSLPEPAPAAFRRFARPSQDPRDRSRLADEGNPGDFGDDTATRATLGRLAIDSA